MPAPGDLLADRYRIASPLGAGGMATVWRARDERLDRDVAVKILLPNHAADPGLAGRFEREARALAAAAHPGVVAVHDVDPGDPATGRLPYFVMELCPGGSLATRLEGATRLRPDEIVPILISVAEGLAGLHERGVVHRDVKPQNILLAPERAKLADFGLARGGERDGLGEATTPGTAVGTLAYLAPEVLDGGTARPAADVYALGVAAFAALTGTLPRRATSVGELVRAAERPAPTVSSVAPELGTAFDAAIAAALDRDPDARPDALRFSASLASALGRWSRERSGRQGAAASAVGAPSSGPAAAPATPIAAISSPDDETVIFEPERTALIGGIPGGPELADRPATEPRASGRRSDRLPLLAIATTLALVVLGASIAGFLDDRRPTGATASGSPSPAASGASSASPSVEPSPSPSPSLPPSDPPPDPVDAALDELARAIEGARGGSDGLNGREANDLQERVARIRSAVADGDVDEARSLAKDLDGRIEKLAKDLADASAERLRDGIERLQDLLGDD